MPGLADAIKASGNEALANDFVTATKDVRNLQKDPSQNELLDVCYAIDPFVLYNVFGEDILMSDGLYQLYGLFKQAYQSPPFEKAPKPEGFLAFEVISIPHTLTV
jgi:acyl-CoA-binding protein